MPRRKNFAADTSLDQDVVGFADVDTRRKFTLEELNLARAENNRWLDADVSFKERDRELARAIRPRKAALVSADVRHSRASERDERIRLRAAELPKRRRVYVIMNEFLVSESTVRRALRPLNKLMTDSRLRKPKLLIA